MVSRLFGAGGEDHSNPRPLQNAVAAAEAVQCGEVLGREPAAGLPRDRDRRIADPVQPKA